jgi:Mg2+ and Co2+ transporter CorA
MTVKTQETSSEQAIALLGLLTEQRDLYRELKSLSGQQAQAIRTGCTEDLLALLSKRQAVIDRLSRSNTQVAPYRERWTSICDIVDPLQRQHVRQVLDEIEQMLNDVVEQDERDRAELKGVQAQIGTQMNQVNRAGRAIQAYGPPATSPKTPTFTDRQG